MITTDQIASKIHIGKKIPFIYQGVGPSRSGTTIFLRIFANSNIQSWYQPIKTILRSEMKNDGFIFDLPSNLETVFLKETIGAGSEDECNYNALDVLIRAGVPLNKIKLILFLRNPISVLSSWITYVKEGLNPEQLAKNMIASYLTVYRIYEKACALKIDALPYVYEFTKYTNPEEVYRKVVNKLNLSITKTTFDWEEYEKSEKLGKIIYLKQESKYQPSGLHDKVKKSKKLIFYDRNLFEKRKLIDKKVQQILDSSDVFDIYEKMVSVGEKKFEIRVDKEDLKKSFQLY